MAEPENAQGLESLVVWKKALQFAVFLSGEIIKEFPVEEKYALSSQLRRACQSIPTNIAEGYGRFYYQEGIRFAYIARGSLEETRSHVNYAHQMGYISNDEIGLINNRIEEVDVTFFL
jgi:four helix bundle protein